MLHVLWERNCRILKLLRLEGPQRSYRSYPLFCQLLNQASSQAAQGPSKTALNVFRDEASITCLGSLLQCLIISEKFPPNM